MIELARRLLDLTLQERAPAAGPMLAPDWGIPLLAALALPADASAIVLAWAASHRAGHGHPGLFSRGRTGTALGLSHAARIEPRLGRLAETARDTVVRWVQTAPQRRAEVTYHDYDLILGASGVTLGLSALPGARPGHVRDVMRYLAGLCDDPELPRLRIGTDPATPWTGWNVGRINHGLAHGVPGILAGLIAAWPLLEDSDRDRAEAAMRNVSTYLTRAHRLDDRGVVSWGFASGEGDPARAWRRQAWCYGTPGVAWQLTEAGRVLGDANLATLGVAAMASLCHAWTDEYLDNAEPGERLAFCHGASGTLAVADAFAIHTGLAAAGRLADHLADVLHANAGTIQNLAETDQTMLTGATGILATLLSRQPGQRNWMRAVGLR